ncbi:MAG: UDP-N-acetylmuramoyl-L-alanyl-D-glutamate--2,6-diaminopimelate ligase [Candidatus Kapaibacterium sp.]
MKNLENLIKSINPTSIQGPADREISSIQYDSRKCSPGCMFVALRGANVDGHTFIRAALKLKAAAIVCEEIPSEYLNYGAATFVLVPDTRHALAALSHRWYDYPTARINLVGITGTNGKTTTSFLVRSIFRQTGAKTGLIGTTGIFIDEYKFDSTHTTPESLGLCGIFDQMTAEGVSLAAMEVSSHALAQHRADVIDFDCAVFTNLSHEHLDYHKTMDEYAAAKKKLFEALPPDASAVVNCDDEYADYMVEGIRCGRIIRVGRGDRADVRIKNERLGLDRTTFTLEFDNGFIPGAGNVEFTINLTGRFNVDNAAQAAAVCLAMGINMEDVRSGLAEAYGAPGRMQKIALASGALGVVDYAHTPDALEKALRACREVLDSDGAEGRLIVVFGCGGDRDKSKRPVMGEIATRIADFAVITNDNPRTEEPDKIVEQIYNGIDPEDKKRTLCISNREEAIGYAAGFAGRGDIVLVAGKGHETYQIIGTERRHFDDAEELRRFA